MSRLVLIALLGYAALLGAAVVLILWTTRAAPPSPRADAALAAAAPEVVEPPLASPAPAPRAQAGRAPGPARAKWRSPAEDPHPIPMADRVTRKAVRRALLAASVQARLARCGDRQLGFGGGAARGRAPPVHPAVLLLELEPQADGVVIVDAGVQSWGGASAASVSCAQEALRGRTIASGPPGAIGRLRMPFPLNPRRGTTAAAR